MFALLNKTRLLAILAWCAIGHGVHANETSEVDFAEDIAPIFRQNCVACHNTTKAEGGLNLESYDVLMKGGDSGAAVTSKDLDDSYLLPRITGEEEPWMPPDDNSVGANRLTEKEIELIRAWINAGAAPPKPISSNIIQWGSLPENLKPVYAMATSPDGQHLAFGRGNAVTVTAIAVASADEQAGDDQSSEKFQTLVDPALPRGSGESASGRSHLDIVQSIAFSPDSQRIATGGYRSVKIWRRKTNPTQILSGLATVDRMVAVSPDGKRLAYPDEGQGLVLVDVNQGQTHRFLKSHTASISALIWTDNTQLISCDEDGQWMLTDAKQYKNRPVELPTRLVATSLVRVAADRILGLNSDQQVFDLQTKSDSDFSRGALVRSLEHEQPVLAIALAGDASQLAVALSDGTIRLTDVETEKLVHELKSPEMIRSLTLNQDGSLLLTTPQSGPVGIWKTEDGKLIAELDRDYSMSQKIQFASANISRQKLLVDLLAKRVPDLQKAAEKEVEARGKLKETRDKAAEALAASKQGHTEAKSGLSDAQQALTQAEQSLAAAQKKVEEMTASLEANKKAVADATTKEQAAQQELDKREQALATASKSVERAQAAIPVFNERITSEKNRLTAMEGVLGSLEAELESHPAVVSAAFNRDGSRAILAGEDNTIRIFSVDGQPAANLETPAEPLILISSDDGTLSSLTTNGQYSAWNLDLGWELERTIGNYQDSPFSDRVTALDFSPDGQLLAVGSGPPSRFGEIKLMDVASGQVARDLGEVHSDTVFGLKFSPDGRQLASAAADKLCRLFDVESGDMLRAFEGHTHHVLSVTWHESGQTLATASADASIKLWKGETGEQIRTIGGFSKEVTSLAFVRPSKPDGANQIVSASADGFVRLHDADSGKQIKVLKGTGDALYGVVTLDDDKHVSAGGQQGKVWTWRLADAKLLGELPVAKR